MRRRALERHRSAPSQTALLPQGEYYYWNPAWIPFAYNENGNSLFISQADDDTLGRIGTHDKEDGPSFPDNPVFTSLPHLLDGVAQALNDGVFEIWGEWDPSSTTASWSGKNQNWKVTECGTYPLLGRMRKAEHIIARGPSSQRYKRRELASQADGAAAR